MYERQRVALSPSSLSQQTARFVLQNRGLLSADTLNLEIAFEILDTQKSYWFPRVGAYALIQSVQLLKNSKEISFINNVPQYACIKSMTIHDKAQQAIFESKTLGKLSIDSPHVGGILGGVDTLEDSKNAQFLTYPQYSTSCVPSLIKQTNRPFLPLKFILQYFETNRIIDLNKDKYEILINFAQSNRFVNDPAGTFKFTAETRLFYESMTIDDEIQRPMSMPWFEVRTSSFVLPALNADTTDDNQIPIRFSNFSASAIIFQFNYQNLTLAAASVMSPAVSFGQTQSMPLSFGSYTVNLIVNDRVLFGKPITQESMRLHHLERAMSAIYDQPHLQVPTMTSIAISQDVTADAGPLEGYNGHMSRNFSNIMALCYSTGNEQILASGYNYFGFDIRENGSEVFLNQSGIFLQVQRSSGDFPINAIVGNVFIIGKKTE